MRGDLIVKGLQTSWPVRVAASATRYESGEPLHNLGALTNGVTSVNTYVLAAADTPVIGTHNFGGVAEKGALPFGTGTLVAHKTNVARPVAAVGLIQGRAETVASVDTDSELIGFIGDVSLIDYNATGGADGGELYTIKEVASADTSGLIIVDGIPSIGALLVSVESRAYRSDVS